MAAKHTTAEVKHRVTFVNISGVRDWFMPSNEPEPLKHEGILIAPCSTHCRLERITKDGCWDRAWYHECSDGSIKSCTKGAKVGNIIAGWRAARDAEEHPALLNEIMVWGQPRAWTDELIAS